MLHDVAAPVAGVVREILVAVGATVLAGARLATVEEVAVAATVAAADVAIDLDRIRPDLAEVLERHGIGLDAAPAGRRRPPSDGGSPDSSRERRRSRRRRIVRRVRPGGHRRPAPASRHRRPHRAHPGRWHGRRHRHRQRRHVQRSCCTGRGVLVRLHRPRRHAGPAEPSQEGSPLRGRRAAATARRVLHRRRWWPALATPMASA